MRMAWDPQALCPKWGIRLCSLIARIELSLSLRYQRRNKKRNQSIDYRLHSPETVTAIITCPLSRARNQLRKKLPRRRDAWSWSRRKSMRSSLMWSLNLLINTDMDGVRKAMRICLQALLNSLKDTVERLQSSWTTKLRDSLNINHRRNSLQVRVSSAYTPT